MIPTLVLSDRDRELATSMKAFGVLVSIDGNRLPAENGVAYWIVCSDGHRFSDVMDHMRKVTNGVLPHPFSDHGTPLFLAPESPLNRNNRGDNLLESIGQVPRFKQATKGWICPHAPCTAATLHGLDIAQQILLAKVGKQRILQAFPSMDVAILVSLTVRVGVEHTYATDGKLWRQWHKEVYPSFATKT